MSTICDHTFLLLQLIPPRRGDVNCGVILGGKELDLHTHTKQTRVIGFQTCNSRSYLRCP